MNFEDFVISRLGEFGRYQKLQLFLVSLPCIITAMNALAWTFAGANVPHRCRTPEEILSKNSGTYELPTEAALKYYNESYTSDAHDYPKCTLGDHKTCPNGYVYNNSEITYSAAERWDIVCDRSVLKAIIQSMYYVGQMLGSLVFGFLGDRIGRKKVFMIAILLQIVSGLGMVIAPFWFVYALFRIAIGFTHPGIFVIANVIGVELVGPSKRKLASIVTGACFALGQAGLGVIAYFIRDYRFMHLVITMPTFLFLSYWWLVPESARWLVSQRKFKKADVILKKAAQVNKATIPDNWWENIDTPNDSNEKGGVKKYNFFDLIRTPKIRKHSLAAFFCWPVVSMVYYGVAMNTNFLGGDLYFTFIIGSLVEIPAILVAFFAIDRIGRKKLLAGGYTLAAICMLSNLVIGDNAHHIIALIQFVVAKASIGCTYATLYAFTPELFPTVIRNIAMGCCSMMARIGAISASFIAMWLVNQYGKIAMILPFSSLSLAAALIAMVFLPETSGKRLHDTIEEIENLNDDKKNGIDLLETRPLKNVESPSISPQPPPKD